MTATGSWTLPAAALSEMQGGLRQSMQQLVRDQLAEQRRFMLATFEAFARRMGTEIKDGIAKVPVPPTFEPVLPPPPPSQPTETTVPAAVARTGVPTGAP